MLEALAGFKPRRRTRRPNSGRCLAAAFAFSRIQEWRAEWFP
ncbi:hypothetical protein RK21_04079 [Pseudomonas plecoglossicida]|nr:hypothetical protein RK21_04079 [Pseudomonas plecoglossicida]